ncbi:hypothetical protein I2494_04375 [Budviciaceae bacterium BWR-B9]|uniref:GNAT family N-acetyltransferase n=1 Tax=Limnobaculum allomyrinae TaxID=2791986 RepID=A0ABS1INT0_9GAMM|nr:MULTISPECIES: hypothetical protein [Limnobaculum]MBK5142960.1 hypothetical protein [Limnobaculum allomyrinae]MBV7690153.1 hypothetical protein [Limnobaculum sp. M2-1]
MSYVAYFQKINTLSVSTRQRMAAIYFQCYAGSDIKRFLLDLESKDEVLMLEHNQELVGFSSLQFYPYHHSMIVYSGDTIVMPEHWQQQVLHKAWIQRMGLFKQQHPGLPLYWFLLVKGYRTYKYLVVFAREFYPHWQIPQPELKQLADRLAEQKFGQLYNAQRGVVECPPDYGFLAQKLAIIPPASLAKPDARFFLEKNPHYAAGHELVCLCEIRVDNLPLRCRSLLLNPVVEYRE